MLFTFLKYNARIGVLCLIGFVAGTALGKPNVAVPCLLVGIAVLMAHGFVTGAVAGRRPKR